MRGAVQCIITARRFAAKRCACILEEELQHFHVLHVCLFFRSELWLRGEEKGHLPRGAEERHTRFWFDI